ncbi:Ribonuclease [Aspergillus udagawae]|nr:Ribonuclease [Aspergillus udagawae]
MATTRDARFVQDRLGYRFKDEAILRLALTAAGKGGAEDGANKRGNSRLAHLGNFLMQFLLAWIGFGDDRTRADTSTLATRFNSADHCAKVAEKAELDRCLKYDMRSGSRSAVVLRKAVNAIMAAIFLDSRDIHQVLMAVTNLGLVDPGHSISEWIRSDTGRLFGHDDFGVDPRLLSTSQTTAAESFRQVILANTFQSAVEGGLTETSGRIAQDNSQQEASISAIIGTEVNDAAETLPSTAAGQMENMGHSIEQVDWDLTDFFNYPWDTLNGYGTSTELLDPHVVPDMPPNREIGTNPLHSGMFHPSSSGPEVGTKDSPDDVHARKRRKHGPVANPSGTVMTGSSSAIATLREFVCSYQTEDDFRHWQIGPTVSPQMRFNIIKELDSKIALYGLLRRYHILHFYVECVPADSRALSNFINTDPNDFQQKSKAGNPGYNAKSEVTLLMMREIYPEIDSSSLEYKSKYRAVSKLQTLGRRYLSLADRFGKGVLGLLPPSNLTNSDNMYVYTSEFPFISLTHQLT